MSIPSPFLCGSVVACPSSPFNKIQTHNPSALRPYASHKPTIACSHSADIFENGVKMGAVLYTHTHTTTTRAHAAAGHTEGRPTVPPYKLQCRPGAPGILKWCWYCAGNKDKDSLVLVPTGPPGLTSSNREHMMGTRVQVRQGQPVVVRVCGEGGEGRAYI